MPDSKDIGIDSPAVQKHLEMMQGIISRMAENSRSCKLWCITLVAAILVLVSRTKEPDYIFIALAPAVLFFFLDSYYLALERAFRKSYDTFVCKLHENRLKESEVYRMASMDMGWRLVVWCMLDSLSILPFYTIIIATIVVARCWIL